MDLTIIFSKISQLDTSAILHAYTKNFDLPNQQESTFEFREGTVIYSGHMKIMSFVVFLFIKFHSSWVLFSNKTEVLICILWFFK